jgi:hypothetical protein
MHSIRNWGSLSVESVTLDPVRHTTYNFEVDVTHTYFVGEHGIWVHNNPCAQQLEKHHPLPMFLGGHVKQTLRKIPIHIHKDLHTRLRKRLKQDGIDLPIGSVAGSSRVWAEYLNQVEGRQRKAFDAVLDISREIDFDYGTNITRDVWHNILNGSFESFR